MLYYMKETMLYIDILMYYLMRERRNYIFMDRLGQLYFCAIIYFKKFGIKMTRTSKPRNLPLTMLKAYCRNHQLRPSTENLVFLAED